MPLYGPKFPLKSGNHDTFELHDDINQQISFYLKNLLLTSPGENLSDMNYGVGIRRFIFEQNAPSVRSNIANRISSQISIYLPYLTVQDIEINADPDDVDMGLMRVQITYTIPGDASQQLFELDAKPENNIGFY